MYVVADGEVLVVVEGDLLNDVHFGLGKGQLGRDLTPGLEEECGIRIYAEDGTSGREDDFRQRDEVVNAFVEEIARY